MAYSDPISEKLGPIMCGDGKHDWHMQPGQKVGCCRCGAVEAYATQVSEGPHDSDGDVAPEGE